MVTPEATRTPMAAILRSGLPAAAGSHTPERPVTRAAEVSPYSAHRSISASSSRRT